MRTLTYGFYGEGQTEYDFLRPLIDRLLNQVLAAEPVDIVWDGEVVPLAESGLPDHIAKLRFVMKQAEGRALVVFHADSDLQTYGEALLSRFREPHKRASEEHPEIVSDLVPVIVVRSTEAWMLADIEALRGVLGLKATPRQLRIPTRGATLEKRDAEALMETVLQAARAEQKRPVQFPEVCTFLSQRLDLRSLEKLSAYHHFLNEMQTALKRQAYLKD